MECETAGILANVGTQIFPFMAKPAKIWPQVCSAEVQIQSRAF
jgi:hypothetical protein